MFDRFDRLINQYTHSCNKKICILTDNNKDIIIKHILSNHKNIKIGTLTDDFSEICLIVIKYKVINGVLTNFMNNHIDKKILLIVDRDFNFDELFKTSKAHSIDTIILKDAQDYFIILSNP